MSRFIEADIRLVISKDCIDIEFEGMKTMENAKKLLKTVIAKQDCSSDEKDDILNCLYQDLELEAYCEYYCPKTERTYLLEDLFSQTA